MSCLRIGLTGSIASGKSQATHYFSELSVPIIDADKIAKKLLAKNAPLLEPIKEKFGESIFHESGELDRKALGDIVFNSREELQWLNQLLHPKVNQKIQQQLSQVKSPYVIIDIPLLIDSTGKIPAHLQSVVDRVLVVDIDPQIQLDRLCARDNITSETALNIMSNQATQEQRLALADDIIDNSGNLSQLESQVHLLHNQYMIMSNEK